MATCIKPFILICLHCFLFLAILSNSHMEDIFLWGCDLWASIIKVYLWAFFWTLVTVWQIVSWLLCVAFLRGYWLPLSCFWAFELYKALNSWGTTIMVSTKVIFYFRQNQNFGFDFDILFVTKSKFWQLFHPNFVEISRIQFSNILMSFDVYHLTKAMHLL
jgi:hypothetical protein